MANKRDYYEVLGISKTSTPEEIKKAYRKKAMKFHPDVNKSPDAEAKFKEINEANEVLSDPNKKANYDRFGHNGPMGGGGQGFGRGFGGFQQSGSINLDDLMGGGMGGIFEEMFGFGHNPNAPRKGRSVAQRVAISLKDAFKGKKITLKTPSGSQKTIEIPKGIRSGQEIRMQGEGQPGINGGPNGDLHLEILVTRDIDYQVKGVDLLRKIKVDYLDLLDVTEKSFTFLNDDNLKVKIPALHNPKNMLRLKGKGMPILNSHSHGDLYIEIEIVMPKKISKKGKKLIDEIKKEVK